MLRTSRSACLVGATTKSSATCRLKPCSGSFGLMTRFLLAPVVGVVQGERVWPVAQITARQPGRQSASDRQVERGDLLGHRGEGPFEEAVVSRHVSIPSGWPDVLCSPCCVPAR